MDKSVEPAAAARNTAILLDSPAAKVSCAGVTVPAAVLEEAYG